MGDNTGFFLHLTVLTSVNVIRRFNLDYCQSPDITEVVLYFLNEANEKESRTWATVYP